MVFQGKNIPISQPMILTTCSQHCVMVRLKSVRKNKLLFVQVRDRVAPLRTNKALRSTQKVSHWGAIPVDGLGGGAPPHWLCLLLLLFVRQWGGGGSVAAGGGMLVSSPAGWAVCLLASVSALFDTEARASALLPILELAQCQRW